MLADMSALRLSRRGLFGGFAALLAAPAIVRVASIMPVKALPTFEEMVREVIRSHPSEFWRQLADNNALFERLREDRPMRIVCSNDFYSAYRDALAEAPA